MKRAIITGISGQDGAYLTRSLLDKGYKVFGTFRRTSSTNFWRLEHLDCIGHPNLELVEYDLTDPGNAISLIAHCKPDEIYNLAAQSFVGVSFMQPVSTAHATGLGALHLLEAIRLCDKSIKFYQASTSEMFGKVREIPQTEDTPFHPRSPYGFAKLFAHWAVVNYRESYDMFACSGILFNHESPLRGLEFVTRKITDGVARVALGKSESISLGNIDAKRDWGFAADYVEGMWRMMQQDTSDTFVLATNRTETVRDFATLAFKSAGIEVEWSGSDVNEIATDKKSGKTVVKIDPKFYRPAEVDLLIGDASRANRELGWVPETTLEDLCAMMVKADLTRNQTGFRF
ncbi:GDP-mannose 4,6-dehydratase [Henriciella litoralis]|uniref:GDP-mannose 4,6-dehydratase n=1 Tax=Henriciella litoralis TaxID=568102 RepID=UPI000A039BA9|nr:GDP-mannose 4,6-dehydratase [Henriciella litoralis]